MTTATTMVAAGGALLLAVTLGCGAGGASKKAESSRPGPTRDPMEITVSPELAKQIQVGEPQWGQVAGTLRISGRLEADETQIARVSAPVTGRITELSVVEGQTVKRGDIVARIHSTQLSEAQSNFLKAVSQRRLAERAVDRARRLLEADVIGEAELQRREAELAQQNAELASLRDQLKLLGMSEVALERLETSRTVNSFSQVVATIDGTVMERKVTIGQFVQAAESVCVLADLSRLWLVADVPEQAAGAVEVGKQVEAEVPALPEQKLKGKLTFVSATVNPDTRTVRIRMDVANPRGRLKPAMLATMSLLDAAENHRIVPVGAVVRESNQDYIFVQTAGQSYRLRRVSLGMELEGKYVLLEGIQPGEKVVLDGAFHLNNERKRLALQGSS
ncbi:MAG: efflux RND transporter periplasmic adaptor subunit [Bryobacterales bacterium]|nr:efflux RND transporter periplasmic adaptor subunit [Bryobacterales bacterium]